MESSEVGPTEALETDLSRGGPLCFLAGFVYDGPPKKKARPSATPSRTSGIPPAQRQPIRLSELLSGPTPSPTSALADSNRFVFHFHMSGP